MTVRVGVIMGSQSDWETMKHACDMLEELGVPYEKKVVSAHRTPDLMFEYAASAVEPRHSSDYCRSRRCGAFTRNGSSQNGASGYWCSGQNVHA